MTTFEQLRSAATAVPAVRKVAAQCGVDLTSVTATGAGGRLTVDDVRAAASRQAIENHPSYDAELEHAIGAACDVRAWPTSSSELQVRATQGGRASEVHLRRPVTASAGPLPAGLVDGRTDLARWPTGNPEEDHRLAARQVTLTYREPAGPADS